MRRSGSRSWKPLTAEVEGRRSSARASLVFSRAIVVSCRKNIKLGPGILLRLNHMWSSSWAWALPMTSAHRGSSRYLLSCREVVQISVFKRTCALVRFFLVLTRFSAPSMKVRFCKAKSDISVNLHHYTVTQYALLKACLRPVVLNLGSWYPVGEPIPLSKGYQMQIWSI